MVSGHSTAYSNAAWAAPAGECCRNTVVIPALLYASVRLQPAGVGHSLPCQKHRQGHPQTGLGTAECVGTARDMCRIQHVLPALQVCRAPGTGRKQDTLLGIARNEPWSGCFSRVRLTKSFMLKRNKSRTVELIEKWPNIFSLEEGRGRKKKPSKHDSCFSPQYTQLAII